MKRRTLLSTAGVGLATGLAGCGSDETSSDDPSDNGTEESTGSPELEEISLETATTAQVDEPVTIAVSVTNSGDAAGSFEDTLTLEGVADGSLERELPAFSEAVEIEEVPAGETGTAEIETVAFEHADRYEFALEDEGVTESIEVGPALTAPDESFTLAEDLRVTVTDVSLENGVFYRYTSGVWSSTEHTGLYAPASGYLLAAFRFEVENVGTTGASVPKGSFEVRNGDFVSGLPDGASLRDVETLDGEPFFDVSLSAGESTDAFLIAQFAREDIGDGVGVDYQRDERGTLPEARFGLESDDGAELSSAAFELEAVSVPDEAEIRSDPTLEYTVRNVGDEAGTFRGIVQQREDDEWSDWETVSVDLEAGETETVSVESTVTDVTAVDYRLDPFDEERTVVFQPATRDAGEWFTIPRGLELRVTEHRELWEIEQEYATQMPDDGYRYVLVSIDVHRPNSDAAGYLSSIGVDDDQFVLEIGENEFDQASRYYNSYEEPVDGPSVNDVEVSVGETATAYTYFEVPETLSLDDAVVRWEEDDGDAEATWQL